MRMTIKRRLLLSNILMVVIPIVLTLVLVTGVNFIFMNRFGLDPTSAIVPNIPVEQGQFSAVDFSEIEFPVQDTVLFDRLDSGDYVLVLPESMGSQFEGVSSSDNRMVMEITLFPEALANFLINWEGGLLIIILFVLVVLVFVINLILTKFVFKPIITSLNVLTEGVHEISVGNLKYRLKHDMGNEFDAVGTNFNEMATRLHEMVEQRAVDAQNRKELIAGISHDLRTPLTSIRTYAEGIELGMATTPEKQQQYLSTIKNKTRDIEHIINQLFLFSKLDIGEFPLRLDKRNVSEWLTDFVESNLEEYVDKKLRIELNNCIKDEYFLVDSVQLRNVLINILENSVKYGKNPDGLGLMQITCMKDFKKIVITMTDNGRGVPNEDLSKLFDVFYRSDKARSNPGQGSGLGLAISAKMIERMGGSISATNVDDGGLQIILKLPAVKGEI